MNERDIVLEGFGVRLEPAGAQHLQDLRELCNDPVLWQYTFSDSPFTGESSARAWLQAMRSDPRTLGFAVLDEAGRAIGSTRYFDIEPPHRKLEIGYTFLAQPYWRTHVNTACKLLLLSHAFEQWRCVRVQFKAEAGNLRSRSALEGIGATFEGTLRNYRIRPDGEQRSTSFYSIIDTEWPKVRDFLRERLAKGPALAKHG